MKSKKVKKPIMDICYDVPITICYDKNRVVGHATLYKNRFPKNPNFGITVSKRCRGNFDKNKVTDYEILEITLLPKE